MEDVVGKFAKRLAISETEVEVVMPPEDLKEGSRRWFMVGELFTHKSFKLEFLANTMKNLWIPKDEPPDRNRITVSRVGEYGRILFMFKNEADLKRAKRGCPWTFDKALLALAVTTGEENPDEIDLSIQCFWIRIRGLPPTYLRDGAVENTGRCLGQAIGVFVQAARGSSNPCLGEFLRVRVGIDLSKPLRKWVSFRPSGWSKSGRFELEYERLPHFCFFCGLMGHTGGNCPRREAGVLTALSYDNLIHADRKEEWLLNKMRSREREKEQVSTAGAWRFGLYPKKKTGWVMTAPELQSVGFVRTRSELEMEGGIRRREDDMEVDSSSEMGERDGRSGKRRRFGTNGRAQPPEMDVVVDGVTHAESSTLITFQSQGEKLGLERNPCVLEKVGEDGDLDLIGSRGETKKKEVSRVILKESGRSNLGEFDMIVAGVTSGGVDGENRLVLGSDTGIKDLGRIFRESFKADMVGNIFQLKMNSTNGLSLNSLLKGQAQAAGAQESKNNSEKQIPQRSGIVANREEGEGTKMSLNNSSRCAQHLSVMGLDLTHHEK
ncbi:hypothetical protein ACLB2K_055535 [Fragaria x ananassa]